MTNKSPCTCYIYSCLFCLLQAIVAPASDGSSVSDSPTTSPNASPTPTHPNNSEDTQSVQKKELEYDVSSNTRYHIYNYIRTFLMGTNFC